MARHFGIDEKRVRNDLQALPRRIDGGWRKTALPSVEEELVVWIDEMRAAIHANQARN